MIPFRILLRLVPALLVVLLFAAPAAAEPWAHADATVAAHEGAAPSVTHPPRLADHASKRPHRSAVLEEFFEIDDDAEQYFKPLPVFARDALGAAIATRLVTPFYRTAPRSHRVCAAYPTGPPHA